MGAVLLIFIIGLICTIYGAYRYRNQYTNGFMEDSVHKLFYIIGMCCAALSAICFLFLWFTR